MSSVIDISVTENDHPCMNQVSKKPKEYKTGINPIWCAGCGHYGILNGLYRALSELGIAPESLMNISGIGCSSRTPYFVDSYKMHTLHGRAGAVATGAQLARPDLITMVVGGDGDGFSIGGGHMPHMARKNVDMSYILMDNRIYGLTKGQVSPTSRRELKAYTTPYGGVEEPMDPVLYMLTYGATYVAQASATKPKLCAELIKGALQHKGFAYINIFSQCPSFNKIDTAQYFKELIEEVPEDHDVSDLDAAMHLINSREKAQVGLLYQVDRPTLDDNVAALVKGVNGHKDYDINDIIALSRP